jgi:predicted nucleic acid-binding Zn ribbon protein
VSDAELEAMIRSHRPDVRHCPECGARPEPDALYCSGCGRVLPGHCAHCGAPVNEPDARFCASCGTGLAA